MGSPSQAVPPTSRACQYTFRASICKISSSVARPKTHLLRLKSQWRLEKFIGTSLPDFTNSNLLAVDFFAQRVNDWAFGVLRFERGHDLTHGGGEVHGNGSVQPGGVLEEDVGVQEEEVGPGGGLAEGPLQVEGERQAGKGHVDGLVVRHEMILAAILPESGEERAAEARKVRVLSHSLGS